MSTKNITKNYNLIELKKLNLKNKKEDIKLLYIVWVVVVTEFLVGDVSLWGKVQEKGDAMMEDIISLVLLLHILKEIKKLIDESDKR